MTTTSNTTNDDDIVVAPAHHDSIEQLTLGEIIAKFKDMEIAIQAKDAKIGMLEQEVAFYKSKNGNSNNNNNTYTHIENIIGNDTALSAYFEALGKTVQSARDISNHVRDAHRISTAAQQQQLETVRAAQNSLDTWYPTMQDRLLALASNKNGPAHLGQDATD